MFDGLMVMFPTVMAFFMASLLFFVSRTAKKFDNIFDERPVAFWAMGFFLLATAWMQSSILTFFNNTSPTAALIFFNNLIYCAAIYLWPYGVWLRNRMGFPLQWCLPVVAVHFICLFSFIFVFPDYSSRSVVNHTSGVVMSVITIIAIIRFPTSRYGDRLLILGFVLFSIFSTVSAAAFFSQPADSFFNNANTSVELLKTFAPSAYAFMGICFLGVMLLDVIEELSEKSRHDYLTGLYNRFGFEQAFLETQEKAKRIESRGMVLVLVDLDKFKSINDKYGHSVGDKALTWFSTLLLNSCRKSDVVGRLGGDEFIMLLWDCDLEQCNEFLSRFAKRCKASPLPDMDEPIFVSASFGMCQITENKPLDDLLLCADKNLYSAKSSEHNVHYDAVS